MPRAFSVLCPQRMGARAGGSLPIALVVLSVATGCASNGGSAAPVGEPVTPRSANPAGDPYPTNGTGSRARTSTARGDRLPNMAFEGYRSATSTVTEPIAFADYYDPSGARVKVLHLMVAAAWCGVCQEQADAMVESSAQLAAWGVHSVQILINGSRRSAGPTADEFAAWRKTHGGEFAIAADALGQQIGEVSPLDAVPWNAFVDARTMEILVAGAGAPVSFRGAAERVLQWVSTNPPTSYE